MFILDDLLAAPFKGILWIVEELVAAAEEEQAGESDRLKDRLRELYLLLETGQLTEAEFDAEESTLLDRLDALDQNAAAADDGTAADEDADDEDAYEDSDEDVAVAADGDTDGDADAGPRAEPADSRGADDDSD